MLENVQNYYMFAPIAYGQKMVINVRDINLNNWYEYFNGLVNILKDGIELDEVHRVMVTLVYENEEPIDISLPDLYINLILWYAVLRVNMKIGPQHLVIKPTFTGDDIKEFIDTHVLETNRMIIDNKTLNNIIADTLTHFIEVDNFSLYLLDTLTLEDDIELMNKSKEFYDLLHCDLSRVPIEKVKDEGMKIVNRAIQIIMDSKDVMGYSHYLRNAFAAKEGINIRQYKENHFNIGTKPDGQGSIYHEIINNSYITGGLDRLIYQLIDSGTSRVAQIISKKEVGDSGGFSRILGLNNIGTYLHKDPTYDCHTNNFVEIVVSNREVLRRLKDRYYRIHPHGQEFLIHKDDTFLIGNKIYLRSPITCASKAMGEGVCYKCYGNLAFTNVDVSIGRIATELITSSYTQMKLSAKHLLETNINIISWNDAFRTFFSVDTNTIKPMSGIEWGEAKLILDPDQIEVEDDDEFFKHKFYNNENHDTEDEGPFYNEYITSFNLQTDDGKEYIISSESNKDNPETKMYLSSELTNAIKIVMKNNTDEEDAKIVIPMEMLDGKVLFYIKIQNNDLGKNLDIFNDLINKKPVTKLYSKDQLLERLLEVVMKSGIQCQSIHLEIIISNQIRSAYDRLKECNWWNIDEPYEILTLNEALTDNPSVINSLIYQKLRNSLYYPLTYQKIGTSIFDPFFMRKPKKFLNAQHEVYDYKNRSNMEEGENPLVYVRSNGTRPVNFSEIVEQARNRPKTELD